MKKKNFNGVIVLALVKYTAIVDRMSGKLNGSVFSNNKGGAYIRSKSTVSNPQTSAQMAVRATFGAIASAWSALTESARNAWNQATGDYPYINRMGDSKTLSGFALHQKINTNLSLISRPTVTLPPAPEPPAGVVDLTITPSQEESAHFFLEATVTGDDTNSTIAVYATPQLRAGVENFDNQLRFIGTIGATEFKSSGYAADVDYTAVFGGPAVGSFYGFKIVAISTISGQVSAPSYFKVEAEEIPE